MNIFIFSLKLREIYNKFEGEVYEQGGAELGHAQTGTNLHFIEVQILMASLTNPSYPQLLQAT